MKEGWEYKTLGEVVSFSRGLTYKKSDEVDYSTKVVLRSTNINVDNNSLNIDELKYLNENIEFEEEKLIKQGSILICMSNASKKHLDKDTLIEHDYKYAFGGFMGLLTPVIKINSKYLYYTLTTPKYKEYIKSLSEGANINNLKIKDIQKYIIPIFPLDEQRRIVSYLDSSFKLIDEIKNKALKSLTEAKALFQSALAEAMEPKEGWEEKTLGELCSIIGGGTPSKKNSSYYNGDIPWATVSDMNCDYLQNTICKISDDGVKNSSTQIISKNEVIIATRVGLGKVCILCQDTAINQDLKGIIPKSDNKLIRKFIFWWFRSKSNYIVSNGVGATVKGAKLSFVSNLKISLPTISTQKQIVSRLDKLSSKVRAIEEKYQKMVEECDALKQAMLRDVFE